MQNNPKYKVIFIDDSTLERRIVETAVTKANYEFASFGDVASGMAELIRLKNENKLSGVIVITDYEMGEQSGLDLIHKMSENNIQVPTMMRSSSLKGIMNQLYDLGEQDKVDYILDKHSDESMDISIEKTIQNYNLRQDVLASNVPFSHMVNDHDINGGMVDKVSER